MKPLINVAMFLAGLAAVVVSTGVLAQEPLGFKGIKLGATEAEIPHTFKCDKVVDNPVADSGCALAFGFQTIARVPIERVHLMLYDGKVVRINLDLQQEKFTQVLDALRERHGPPSSSERSMVQNRAGASFENVVATWKGSTASIRATRYDATLNLASVVFFLNDYDRQFLERYNKFIKEVARDM